MPLQIKKKINSLSYRNSTLNEKKIVEDPEKI